ncbi:MAG: hypothetical protein ACRD82_15045 [Blastocatellia bacterium]
MAKTQENPTQVKEAKPQKESKDKNGALVGRVKKVIKKSRRKMGEEKFEKQLQRTITFLEEMQLKLGETGNSKAEKKANPASKPNGKSKPKKSGQKAKPKSKTAASRAEPTASK